jgi:glycerate 2-kinase
VICPNPERFENTALSNLIEILPGDHPVPESNSEASTSRLLDIAGRVGAEDLVLFMITGGASAMLCKPETGISLSQKQQIHSALLRSGASIHDMNTVRKYLSAVKGGKLLRAFHGATVINFLISDVPGDDPQTIGSGPTQPHRVDLEQVRGIFARFLPDMTMPEVDTADVNQSILQAGHTPVTETTNAADTPEESTLVALWLSDKPNKNNPSSIENVWICTPAQNAAFIATRATREGYLSFITVAACEGDIEQVAGRIISDVQSVLQTGRPGSGMRPASQQPSALNEITRDRSVLGPQSIEESAHAPFNPVLLIYFGESEVKVTGSGKGGRNQHLALLLADQLDRISHTFPQHKVTVLSAGTDGGDGNTDAAGAICTELTAFMANKHNSDLLDYIKNFDSHTFFSELGDIFHTGPTGNNLMDLQLIIIS